MNPTAGNVAFGDYLIDRADERLIGPAGPIRLGNKAWRVLVSLVDHEGRLLTKDALFETVWDGTIVTESSLTSAIKELRRALGDESRTPRYIESVYGRGYRFIAPVHSVETVAEPAARAPAAARQASRSEPHESRPPLILVSPFRDEAIHATHPWYADVLREEVLSGLARFREIQLVADDRPEAEARHGRAAERGYQLVATLLPEGDGVKVIARARRLADGLVLWADTLLLADTGAAGGVEKIVRRIAGAALPAVDEDLLAGLPESDDAYDRYLVAKHRSLVAATFAEAKRAAEALEAVIAERPGLGLAYAPLVRLYNTDFGYTALGASGPAERARALDLAKAGLDADRANVHAYTVLGFCHLWHGQADQARGCFERAVAQNPYNPVRLSECATGLMFMGELKEARALIYRAVELNPIPDDWFHEDLGRLLLFEGAFDEGLKALRSIARCSIWAELYRTLCELGLGLDSGPASLAAWRTRVAQGWHGKRRPTDAEVARWIRFHNPLPAGDADRVFAPAAA